MGWFTCLLLPARAGAVSAQGHRSLRFAVDLTVRRVERCQQQGAALQAGSVADGGDGHVNLRAGTGERRQRRGYEHRSDILHADRCRRNLHSHLEQNVAQRLGAEHGLPPVARARQADHHSVANQRILAHPFNAGQIADGNMRLGWLSRWRIAA